MQPIDAELAAALNLHQLQGDEDTKRCTACGITIWKRTAPRQFGYGTQTWLRWYAPDGREWNSFPQEDRWATYPDTAPSCPPQEVEAQCPWEENARRYGGVWGDVQLDTAQRTWCKRHEMAAADCPEPGEICWGADNGCAWGRCTGREDTCPCGCPVCVGDTPDVWGYDGDY